MSASKEKKTRQEQAASGWTDPRTAREAQQQKEERRNNALYAVIAILFVAAAVVTMVWKSGIVQRTATAAVVNGEKYTAAEVQYYYTGTLNSYGNYLSYLGVDTSKDLRDQECTVSEDSDTWFDYFAKQALDQMADIYALYNKAQAEGFTWNDDMQATFESDMQALQKQVDSYNASRSTNIKLKDYLKLMYGSMMTQKIYEEQLKVTILAQAYYNDYVDSLTYTDSELENAYQADREDYDRVSYQSVKIDGSAETTKDASGNDVEPTDAETAQAMADAKALADSMLASFQEGKSLESLADAEDKATYTSSENGTYTDSVLMNWLFDDGRKSGDTAVLADEDASAYYVVSFSSRFRPDSPVVDVRHILIQPEAGTIAQGEDGYDDEQAQLKADAEAKADELLAQFQSGEATEDAFAALARENSADTGSAANGGLIAGVSQYSSYVEPFLNWCLEKHQPGDTGIVESDYGYHIMYFSGETGPYWKYQATNSLKNDAAAEWYSDAVEGASSETASGIRYVG